jgi:hypothetical protein
MAPRWIALVVLLVAAMLAVGTGLTSAIFAHLLRRPTANASELGEGFHGADSADAGARQAAPVLVLQQVQLRAGAGEWKVIWRWWSLRRGFTWLSERRLRTLLLRIGGGAEQNQIINLQCKGVDLNSRTFINGLKTYHLETRRPGDKSLKSGGHPAPCVQHRVAPGAPDRCLDVGEEAPL